MIIDSLFYFFSFLALISAIMVISSKNPVKSVLFLVLTFVATAVLWMLIEAEFLSLALVLVYVGAVLVLFMFIVMMLDIEIAEIKAKFIKYLPVGISVAALLLIILVFALGSDEFNGTKNIANVVEGYSNINALGQNLFTNYLLEVEVAGIILLVAMVAAISLTYRGKVSRKEQSPHKQIQVKKEQRLRIINMPFENIPQPKRD